MPMRGPIKVLLALLPVMAASLSGAQTVAASSQAIPPTDPRILSLGRVARIHPNTLDLAYPGSGIRFRFACTGLRLGLKSTLDRAALTVVLDDQPPQTIVLKSGQQLLPIGASLADEPHTATIIKRSEVWEGEVTLTGLQLDDSCVLLPPPPAPVRKLLFVGDSVTCGEGVGQNPACKRDPAHPANDAYDSYGLLLGRRLDADTQLVCYGGRGLVRDYRGYTAADNVLTIPQLVDLALPADKPAGRIAWDPNAWQPDGIFISVGTNDFNLEKTSPLDETSWVAEYVRFLGHLRAEYPRAQIFVTEGAIVTDPLLAAMVREAATKAHDPRIHYVASRHYRGYPCNAHPTGDEHRQMADDFEPVLRSTLGW